MRDRSQLVTPADLACVLSDTLDSLATRLDDDWGQTAGGLTWTCWEAVEHLAESLLWYGMQLVPVRADLVGGYPFVYHDRRPGGPEGVVFVRPEVGPAGLLRALSACGGLLVAQAAAAPPSHRAHHMWGDADPEGFTAMGLVELVAHRHDVGSGLGVTFPSAGEVCDRVLARLFPDAPVTGDGEQTLLWATGRVALPGHERLGGDWRWFGAPR